MSFFRALGKTAAFSVTVLGGSPALRQGQEGNFKKEDDKLLKEIDAELNKSYQAGLRQPAQTFVTRIHPHEGSLRKSGPTLKIDAFWLAKSRGFKNKEGLSDVGRAIEIIRDDFRGMKHEITLVKRDIMVIQTKMINSIHSLENRINNISRNIEFERRRTTQVLDYLKETRAQNNQFQAPRTPTTITPTAQQTPVSPTFVEQVGSALQTLGVVGGGVAAASGLKAGVRAVGRGLGGLALRGGLAIAGAVGFKGAAVAGAGLLAGYGVYRAAQYAAQRRAAIQQGLPDPAGIDRKDLSDELTQQYEKESGGRGWGSSAAKNANRDYSRRPLQRRFGFSNPNIAPNKLSPIQPTIQGSSSQADFDRMIVERQKSRFMSYGALPEGFEFLQGNNGRLGSPQAVASRGAMPLNGQSTGIGYSASGYSSSAGAYNPPEYSGSSAPKPNFSREFHGGQAPTNVVTKPSQQNQTPQQSSQTSSGSLSKDNFQRIFKGSKLEGHYDTIVAAAQKYGMNPVIVASIMAQESGRGKHLSGNNPAGIMDPKTKWMKKTQFETLEAGIDASVKKMKQIYDRGGQTIEGMGRIYAPVGAANDPRGLNRNWPGGVTKFMSEFGAETSKNPQQEQSSFETKQSATGSASSNAEGISPDGLKIVDRTREMGGYGSKGRKDPYKFVGVHYTAGESLSGAVAWAKQTNEGYQYLIDKDGTVHMVQNPDTGRSNHWGKNNIHPEAKNSNSIGVSFVGKDNSTITPAQRKAGLQLFEKLKKERGIDPKNFLGHGETTQGHRHATEGYGLLEPFRQMHGLTPKKGNMPSIASRAGQAAWSAGKYDHDLDALKGTESKGTSTEPQSAKPTGESTGVLPVEGGRESSIFGMRLHPKDKVWRLHSGVDYAVKVGTPVKSFKEGTVLFAGNHGGYGYMVDIQHADGTVSRYAHLSKINAKVGDKVQKGQIVALSGNTGKVTGPHLHFEIRKGGQASPGEPYKGHAVDPKSILDEGIKPVEGTPNPSIGTPSEGQPGGKPQSKDDELADRYLKETGKNPYDVHLGPFGKRESKEFQEWKKDQHYAETWKQEPTKISDGIVTTTNKESENRLGQFSTIMTRIANHSRNWKNSRTNQIYV